MPSGGGPSTVSSNTQSNLPAWAVPYGMGLLGQTGNYINSDLAGGYPAGMQAQIAPLSPDQQEGLNLGYAAATGAQGLLGPALSQAQNTLSGAYLNPNTNPYLQGAFNEAALPVTEQYQYATQPGIQAEYAHAGAFGGSAQQQTEGLAQQGLGNALQNLATNIYGGAYQQGVQNQLAEEQLVPGLLGATFAPSQALLNLGGLVQNQQQAQLNAGQQNATNQYLYPYQTLGELAAMLPAAVGGAYNSSSSMTNPNALYPLGGLMAGSLGGYGLGSLLGGSLLGAGAGPLGAGLGGLGGLLSTLL